jgi:pyruvate,water dikinase
MGRRLADLREVDPSLVSVFGGKACGLARLAALGARVPPGFAVEAGVTSPLAWAEADREELERLARGLLAAGRVAVRSSAPMEDSAARSFAGLFETVLGVADASGVLRAAARCIASGGSERVAAYAATGAPLPVGVVVQRQVDARAAGVCFTVDPLGKDRAVLLEAVAGAGDSLVSGRVQPERWRVYRSGLGAWEPHRDPRSPTAVLSAAEAAALAAEAADLAGRFGHPLDLEWALDESAWWLQARPITAAVAPVPLDVERYVDDADDGPVTVWSNWNVRETMPLPFPPLAWGLWRDVILPTALEPLFPAVNRDMFRHALAIDLVQGRIYWNMNGLFATPFFGWLFDRTLARLDARAARVVADLKAAGVLRRRRLPGSRVSRALGLAWVTAKSAVRFLGAIRTSRVLGDLESGAAAIARRPDPSSLSDEDLLREMRLLGEPESRPIARGQSALVAAFLVYSAAEHAFRRHPEAHRLLTAGIGTPTAAISLGIDELVGEAGPLAAAFRETTEPAALLARLEREPGGAEWLERLRGFLARFGHRCPGEFDLSVPRWAEDPSMILGLVRAGLVARPSERATARLARERRRRADAVAAAVAASPRWRRPLLRLLARQVESTWPLREAPKHWAMVTFARMRAAILEMGARLVRKGLLDAREDVLFLEWPEVEAVVRGRGEAAGYRGRVMERKARHERHRAHPAPDFVRSDGVPVVDDEGTSVPEDGVLRGTAVSGGGATGPVRVLRAPDPAAMSDGDVIVVEFADPGWTPLFPRAGAVVMEVGGAMCHAAVVARELGIPAVFGVAGATRLLADGQVVAVDGERGTIALRPAAAPPAPPAERPSDLEWKGEG